MNNLPSNPGLYRRLVYGEYVRMRNNTTLRNRSYHNLRVTGVQTTFTASFVDNIPNDSDFVPEYEELVQLEPVKLGLKMCDVNKNSRVFIKDKSKILHINICIICQEFFNDKDEIIRELSCCHPYHLGCIDKWFENEKFCPICKHILN